MAAVMLARTLLFMEHPGEAMDVVDAARAELPAGHEDLDLALRAIRIVGVFFGVADPANLAELDAWRAGPRSQGPGAKTLTAITSLAVAVGSGDAREAAALAAESLDGDEMPVFDRGTFTVLPATVLALAEPAAAEASGGGSSRSAGRRGSVLDAIGADLWGGLASDLDGRSAGARSSGSSARWRARRCSAARATRTWPTRRRSWRWRGSSAATASGRGRCCGAPATAPGASDGERFWLISHAELLLADGGYGEVHAIADALAATRPPDTHPLWSPWRGLRARAARGRAIGRLRHASRPKSWRSLAAAGRRGSWDDRCGCSES